MQCRKPPLYRSRDAGRTWRPVTLAASPGQADDGSAFTGTPVFAGSAGAIPFTADQPHETVMYRTNDRGASWAVIVPPGPPQWWVADAVTPSVWRLLDGDQLLATDDAGRTWTRTHMNHRFGLLAFGYNQDTPPVEFVSARVGYVDDGRLWRTDDGGRTWRLLPVPGS